MLIFILYLIGALMGPCVLLSEGDRADSLDILWPISLVITFFIGGVVDSGITRGDLPVYAHYVALGIMYGIAAIIVFIRFLFSDWFKEHAISPLALRYRVAKERREIARAEKRAVREAEKVLRKKGVSAKTLKKLEDSLAEYRESKKRIPELTKYASELSVRISSLDASIEKALRGAAKRELDADIANFYQTTADEETEEMERLKEELRLAREEITLRTKRLHDIAEFLAIVPEQSAYYDDADKFQKMTIQEQEKIAETLKSK